MRPGFVCPLCKDRNVTFSGVKDNLIMRATSEWVAGFVCGNFHTFFVLLTDAAPNLGIKRFGDIQKKVRQLRNARSVQRAGGLAVLNHPDEPPGWRELQNLAQQERDPHKLARIVDQMNVLLAKCEKKEANRKAGISLEPDVPSTRIY